MEEELKKTVSEFFEVDLSLINSDFVLSSRRMQGSLARARLDAAIRNRLGVKCQGVYSAKTYGDLEKAILGLSSPPANNSHPLDPGHAQGVVHESLPISNPLGGLLNGLACGIDIEMVENFSDAKDYWKDPFYLASFSALEIAYCLLQENPRMHFAARWCAKEALKKCQPSFLQEELHNIELVSSESGPPMLRHYIDGNPQALPYSVSISHTPIIAVAIVINQNHKS